MIKERKGMNDLLQSFIPFTLMCVYGIRIKNK